MLWFKEHDTRSRYEGLQTILEQNGRAGCLFLTVLSIAEDYICKPIDLVAAIRDAQEHGWLGKDFTCHNQLAMLKQWTGRKWVRTVVPYTEFSSLNIGKNDYTALRYVKGDITHFRRRGYDVYENSRTVKEGICDAVYIYSVK